MDKFFCINCQSEPLCRFTVLEHQKRRHDVLHVMNCQRDPAILAKEIRELVNVDGIKRYRFAGKHIVYLNRYPLNRPNKMNRLSCIVCGRILVNKNIVGYKTEQEFVSLKFCSISCKMKGSAAAGEATVREVAGLKCGSLEPVAMHPAVIPEEEATNPVRSRNAPRALPDNDVLPDEGAHETDEGDRERIPPDEDQAQVEKRRRIPPDEGQAQVQKRRARRKKLLRCDQSHETISSQEELGESGQSGRSVSSPAAPACRDFFACYTA